MARAVLVLLAGLMSLAAGCSSEGTPDEDSLSAPGEEATPSAAASGRQELPAETRAYRGTLMAAGTVLEFSVDRCNFDPEDAGNRNVRLVLDGTGMDGNGAPFHVEFISVFDGAERLQRLRVAFDDGRLLEAAVAGDPREASEAYVFDGEKRVIEGGSEAIITRGHRRALLGEIAFRAHCPPFEDLQQGNLPLR